MNNREIRVGLVGAGSIAQVAELPALAAEPGVTIAGVVTQTVETAESNLARWPIERAYASVEEMIAEAQLDALFVLTPKYAHVRFVELGLSSGLDVFCEKPLATTLADARYVADMADQVGQLLMVAFNRRYAQVYKLARQHFGEDHPQFCVAQKNRTGSEYRATLENAIHMIDLLRWFCGEPEQVTAHSTMPDPYREDGTMALIRFNTGAIGTLVAARTAGEWDERFDAYGDNTSVRVTAPDTVAVSSGGETRLVEMRPRAMGWAQATTTMGFAPEVSHFISCVRERRKPLTDGQEAVRTQELVEEILRQAGLPLEDRADVRRSAD